MNKLKKLGISMLIAMLFVLSPAYSIDTSGAMEKTSSFIWSAGRFFEDMKMAFIFDKDKCFDGRIALAEQRIKDMREGNYFKLAEKDYKKQILLALRCLQKSRSNEFLKILKSHQENLKKLNATNALDSIKDVESVAYVKVYGRTTGSTQQYILAEGSSADTGDTL